MPTAYIFNLQHWSFFQLQKNHGYTLALHTIQKCQKMAGQNTFEILLLNDANMIEEHYETIMKMPNMCPFEKRHFLT